MNDEQLTNNELVLKTAKKRVGFKKHVTLYILINLLLWVLFIFLFKGDKDPNHTFLRTILFIFITWTIIVVGHYFFAMRWNKKMLEKEVEKLMKLNLKSE